MSARLEYLDADLIELDVLLQGEELADGQVVEGELALCIGGNGGSVLVIQGTASEINFALHQALEKVVAMS